MHSIHSQIYKQVQETHIDALVKASFLMPNLGGGLAMTALPPVFMASLVLELLAAQVVPAPFDKSAMVEGIVCPTTLSFLDTLVCGILAAGLEKKRFEIRTSKSTNLTKYTISTKLATYLSLVACGELRRFLTTDRVPFGCRAWVSMLGLGLCSPSVCSPAASISAQPKLDISFICANFQEKTLGFG